MTATLPPLHSRTERVHGSSGLEAVLREVLPIYKAAGQGLWRALELRKVIELRDRIGFKAPVLEIGCGDGVFSAYVFDRIQDGIDINPRVIARIEDGESIYDHVHVMDARAMEFPHGEFRTVFANCVIEHIPELDGVLKESARVLADDGMFVATVPLRHMNDHLAFHNDAYAQMRQRQLFHVNLHTIDEWRARFLAAGFKRVVIEPYLTASDCVLWDRMDLPICVGIGGRYNVGAVLRILGKALPAQAQQKLVERVAHSLATIAIGPQENEPPCAAAIVAWKF